MKRYLFAFRNCFWTVTGHSQESMTVLTHGQDMEDAQDRAIVLLENMGIVFGDIHSIKQLAPL